MTTIPSRRAELTITFDRRAQLQAALIAVAFTAVFYPVFLKLKYTWSTSSDWSHGWIIPLFSIYLVYTHWDRIRRVPIRGAWLGLPVMLGGLLGYQYFLWVKPMTYPQETMMLVSLLGIIIYMCGVPFIRYGWLPWLYLFFAVPLPKGIYFALTDPLRRWAATVATNVLTLFPDLDVERVGSTIEYIYRGTAGSLGVEDACSGMRSTMTLCALGVAVAFLSERPAWQRIVMVAACIPIAVFSNFIRVTLTCVLHIFVDPKYAGGAYHMALGLVTLMLAFAVFSGLGWLLSNLVVDDPDTDAEAAA